MAKVRIIVRPTGLINGQEWPEAGQTMDLPKSVAEGMAAAGDVEIVADAKPVDKTAAKVEKRPAPKANVETRKG